MFATEVRHVARHYLAKDSATYGLTCNAERGPAELRAMCALAQVCQALLRAATRQLHLHLYAY